MIITETTRLIIRNWEDRDGDLLYEINSDPQVMEFFSFVRNRQQSDEMLKRLRSTIDDTGFGFYALESRESGQCIGFTGLAKTDLEPFFPDGTVEIGWRLAPSHWGKGYVTEAAMHLLDYGFGPLSLPEIVSFAVTDNHRSTSVMERIGMKRDQESDFDHPKVPDSTPHLKRHVSYRIRPSDRA